MVLVHGSVTGEFDSDNVERQVVHSSDSTNSSRKPRSTGPAQDTAIDLTAPAADACSLRVSKHLTARTRLSEMERFMSRSQ